MQKGRAVAGVAGNGMAATNSTARGYVIALASAVIMAFTGILIRYISVAYALPPVQLAFWRNFFVVATLLPVLVWRGIPIWVSTARDRWLLAGYGLLLAVFNMDWTIAVVETGAAVATVLVYCSAAYTGIFGWLLLGEALTVPLMVTVGICLAGCAMVCGVADPGVWRMSTLGLVTGLASGLMYAAYSMLGRVAARRGLDAWVTLLYIFGYASLFQAIANVGLARFAPEWGLGAAGFVGAGMEPGCWLALFVLAAGPTLLGFGLYNVSLGMLPVVVANTILLLEPVLTAVIASVWLHEHLSPMQWAGALLIVSGVGALRIMPQRPARADAPPCPARVGSAEGAEGAHAVGGETIPSRR